MAHGGAALTSSRLSDKGGSCETQRPAARTDMQVKQDAPEPGRVCPRCHNAAVVGASSRTWFEFFWIPLIPFKKHRIWICGICRWEMNMGTGPDPQAPHGSGGGGWANNPPPPPPPGQGQGQGQYPPPPGQAGQYAKLGR
ncbi:hypothetical protein Q5752_006122 [Cryptotrichosporon argae]